MAGARPLLLAAVVVLLAVLAVVSAGTTPSILTPIAMTPMSDDGAGEGSSNDYSDVDDAAPVGAPLGTTATKPEDDSSASGAAASPSKNGASAVGATKVAAVAATAAAGYFVF